VTTFNAGKLDPSAPPTIEPSALQLRISKAVYKFRPGHLDTDAFIRLQQDLPIPVAVLEEADISGSRTRQLINLIWSEFRSQALTLEDIATLVTHPRADPSARPVRDRTALLVAVMETLEGTTFPKSGSAPGVTVRRRIGIRDGRHVAYWQLTREVEKE
jgi:hypothetical protein